MRLVHAEYRGIYWCLSSQHTTVPLFSNPLCLIWPCTRWTSPCWWRTRWRTSCCPNTDRSLWRWGSGSSTCWYIKGHSSKVCVRCGSSPVLPSSWWWCRWCWRETRSWSFRRRWIWIGWWEKPSVISRGIEDEPTRLRVRWVSCHHHHYHHCHYLDHHKHHYHCHYHHYDMFTMIDSTRPCK